MDHHYTPMKKYIYIKQQVMDSIKTGQSKVLINPNFMKPPVVHLNPHFKANLTIHVNPNMLKSQEASNTVKLPLPKPDEKVTLHQVKPFITHNKVIRFPVKEQMKNRYTKINVIKQKYPLKIDNRVTTKAVVYKKAVKRLSTSLSRNVYVKYNKKVLSSAVNINCKSLINKASKKVESLLTIRGRRYKMGANSLTLTLLPSKNGKSRNKMTATYLRHSLHMGKHVFLSQIKRKSINIHRNKLKKSNVACPFYRKFGRCKGKENGTCIRIHNDNQISLCTKFLQGTCVNRSCLLSHKVSAEKMPTCRFYLEGVCSKDDCPYLHVKINAKAEICRSFLEGFCKKAAECDKRHQYLCPDFEQKGSCPRKKCQYPHKTVVRNNKVLRNVPPKLQTFIKKTPKLKSCPINITAVSEKSLTIRYYDESIPKQIQIEALAKSDDNVKIYEDKIVTNLDNELAKKRPTVGDLPSFIPFILKEELI